MKNIEKNLKHGTLRVWHIPQVPMKAYRIEVPDLRTAALILQTLAEYDLFQFQNRVKPDYSNAQDLEVYCKDFENEENGPWIEWHCTDGWEINYHMRNGSDFDALVWEMNEPDPCPEG